jgi:uncharacterized membrane protein YfcA
VHVSVAEWLVLAATVVAAATVQGVVGFGANLLAVPVVALVVPAALPGAMVIPGVPMAVAMAVAERDHVDWRGSRFLVLGRLPGTLVGVAVVAAVSSNVLAVVIGVVVILAVGLSVVAAHLHPGVTPRTATATGVVTGVTGTAAAIDGPPLALLYQNDPPPVFRATLATQFTFGAAITLTALVLARHLHPWQALLGLSLMPSYFVGLAASLVIRPRLAHHNLRPVVLTIAALTGVAAIARAIAWPIWPFPHRRARLDPVEAEGAGHVGAEGPVPQGGRRLRPSRPRSCRHSMARRDALRRLGRAHARQPRDRRAAVGSAAGRRFDRRRRRRPPRRRPGSPCPRW